jgi:lysozyme
MSREDLKDMLIRHEGLRLTPYNDSLGVLTIGVGRNLRDVGISRSEADILLQNDIDRAEDDANHHFYWFYALDNARQVVVLSMIFNLGISRFSLFSKTINYIAVQKYREASEEMLKSSWAKQVGQRAIELSMIMQNGKL